MMYDLSLSATALAAVTTALAAVYLLSKDPDRRRRAWKLLKLFLRH